MESNISQTEKVVGFLKDTFNIDASNYNEYELNELIKNINKVLEKRLEIEEEELCELKQKLETSEMLLDSQETKDN